MQRTNVDNIASRSSSSSSTTSLVFIPGAWHLPSCYDRIISLLDCDYTCVRVTLPSTSGDRSATFADDLNAARRAVINETQAGRDVIVVAHSYGGIVGGSVVAKSNHTDDTSSSSSSSSSPTLVAGRVTGLILIASGFNLTGWTFMAPFLNYPPPQWRVNKHTGFAELVCDPHAMFYHDVAKSESDALVANLTTQSLNALFDGGEHVKSGWLDVPSYLIGTSDDRGMPVMAQRLSVGMARAMGGDVTHRELASSHSPFISQPNHVADIIREASTQFALKSRTSSSTNDGDCECDHKRLSECGRAADVSRDRVNRNSAITIPSVTFTSPSSWCRWGLPISVGHIVGWIIRGVWAAKARVRARGKHE